MAVGVIHIIYTTHFPDRMHGQLSSTHIHGLASEVCRQYGSDSAPAAHIRAHTEVLRGDAMSLADFPAKIAGQ